MSEDELKTAGPGHLIIQKLLIASAQQRTLEPAEPRNLVSRHEAQVALLVAAAAVDSNFQGDRLDAFSTETAMSAIAVAWETLEPLSDDVAEPGETVEDFCASTWLPCGRSGLNLISRGVGH
jgi:hypothetical protein